MFTVAPASVNIGDVECNNRFIIDKENFVSVKHGASLLLSCPHTGATDYSNAFPRVFIERISPEISRRRAILSAV